MNLPKRLFMLCTLVISTSLMSACGGWHMRGTYDQVYTNNARVYLQGGSPEIRADMLRIASLNGLKTVNTSDNSDIQINIADDRYVKRIYTVGINEQPTEFLLIYAVDVSAKNGEKLLFEQQEIRREKIFGYDSSNPLAGDNESQIIIDELRRDLARQILYRATLQFGKSSN
jgi:outer membrane lipopolysaccharide assembly protein LptE/RlpB